MKYFEHWRGGLAIVGAAWLGLGFGTAMADTITLGETTYEDVLVESDDASYYILFPEEGTTLTVSREDVDESQLKLTGDRRIRLHMSRARNMRLRYVYFLGLPR